MTKLIRISISVLATLILALSTSMQAQQANTQAIVRIAEIEVHPQYVESFLKIAQEVASASVSQEAGVLCLYPARVSGSQTSFRVIEVYQNKAAYEAHLKTPHFLRYKEQSIPMVAQLRILDTES